MLNSGAIGATTIGAPIGHDRGDQHKGKILPSSPNDINLERSATQPVVRRLKIKHSTSLHLKDWKKKAVRLFQFSKKMYGPLQFVVALYQIHPYAVSAAFVLPLITGVVGEAVYKVREAEGAVHDAVQKVKEASDEAVRLRQTIEDLEHQLAVEGKVVEGTVVRYTDAGWPIIKTEKNPDEVVQLRLYGIGGIDKTVGKDIETKWIEAHTNALSCKVVETSPNGLDPLYRCLAANTFDLAEAMLLNGAAIVSCEAGQSYRDAQDQAKHAKRGIWNRRFSTVNQHCEVYPPATHKVG